ncbi:aldo-keto reductase family 1 member A1-like isoform X1 [Scylla paramamosain]
MTHEVPSVRLNTGQDMPVIGIGTARARGDDVKAAVSAALECGYRHIDTSYLYQNEAAIGEVLKEWFSSGRLKREDLFITSKLPMIGNREKDVSRFLLKSLAMLGLTYVDLYLIHYPVGFIGKDDNDIKPKDEEGNTVLDFETNLEGIWRGMEAQVDAGRAKSIGISNFNSKQVERITKLGRIKPANQQVEVHAYHMQRDLRAVCEKHSITVCAFCPIGAPHMKIRTEKHPPLLEHPLVVKIASQRGKTTAQILLRHLIQHGLVVIPKSVRAERIKQNFQVFDFELSPEEMAQLDTLDRGGAGRMFTCDFFKGIERHPEHPFNIPF